jgi:hypothetical protein
LLNRIPPCRRNIADDLMAMGALPATRAAKPVPFRLNSSRHGLARHKGAPNTPIITATLSDRFDPWRLHALDQHVAQ